MLIDEFLPSYEFVERHHIEVEARPDRVWSAVRGLDLGESLLTRGLFLVRGLPIGSLGLEGLVNYGFVLLGERTNQEILLGLIGRFWLPTGGIVRVDADQFQAFKEPGYGKAAWNFSLGGHNGETRLATETRIACTAPGARRLFRIYWTVVRPFSGVIRQEALRTIKRHAERD